MPLTEPLRVAWPTSPAEEAASGEASVLKALTCIRSQFGVAVITGLNKRPSWPRHNGAFSPADLVSGLAADSQGPALPVPIHDLHHETETALTPASFFTRLHETDESSLYWKDGRLPLSWTSESPHQLEEAMGGPLSPLLPLSGGDHQRFCPAETLMLYAGKKGSYTALHWDPAASESYNIMVHSDDENTSAEWFVVPTCYALQFYERFRVRGDLMCHVRMFSAAELDALPYPVYHFHQQVGDLVLLGPLSWHQVRNQGGTSIKVSWSQLSIASLRLAVAFHIPVCQRTCTPVSYGVPLVLMNGVCTLTEELCLVLSHDSPRLKSKPAFIHHVNTLSTFLKLFFRCLVFEWSEENHEPLIPFSGRAHVLLYMHVV
ncbi:hypothetical protein CALCODRAFT_541477 [Calocera cornea HHB12733]|uniref:JmjC domain-containing protein n=1 Tax=Calocera cornea HHB12733 TaxID=1353952 RepID=A0A165G3K1_9BASI|nr:hypothetical protein CALCODRAFT_541477 [Calocera cornea HHB12733]